MTELCRVSNFKKIFFISILTLVYTQNIFAKDVFLLDAKPITKDQEVQYQMLLKQAERLGINEEDLKIDISGLAVTFNQKFSEVIKQVNRNNLPYRNNYILNHASKGSDLSFNIRNEFSDQLDEQLKKIRRVYDDEKLKQPQRNKTEANKFKLDGNKLESQKNNIENKIGKFNDYLGQAKLDYDKYSQKIEENNQLKRNLLAKIHTLDKEAASEINHIISSRYPTFAPIKIRKKNNILNDIKEGKPNKKTKECKQKKNTYQFTDLSSEFNSCFSMKIKKDWISKEELIVPIKKRAKEYIVLLKKYEEIKSDKSLSKKRRESQKAVKNMTSNAPAVLGFEVKKLDKELIKINEKIAKHDNRIRGILNSPFSPYENNDVINEIENFRTILYEYYNEIVDEQINKNNVEFIEFDEWEFSVPDNINHAAFFYKLSSNLKTERYGLYETASMYSDKIEISKNSSKKLRVKYEDKWSKTDYVKTVFYYLTINNKK